VTFALMSVSSPWLWSVHSRRTSRDALLAAGDLEPHAVRLGMTRWTWHPVRSARVMWLATWEGECSPKAAIALLPPPVSATSDATPVATGDTDDSGGDKQDDKPPATAKAELEAAAAAEGVSVRTIQRRRAAAAKAKGSAT
jgi:hypothetical protein